MKCQLYVKISVSFWIFYIYRCGLVLEQSRCLLLVKKCWLCNCIIAIVLCRMCIQYANRAPHRLEDAILWTWSEPIRYIRDKRSTFPIFLFDQICWPSVDLSRVFRVPCVPTCFAAIQPPRYINKQTNQRSKWCNHLLAIPICWFLIWKHKKHTL